MRTVPTLLAVSDVVVSIELDTTPAEAWAIVEPVENHVDWMADAVAIRFETEQSRGVGTTFLCDTKIGPLKLTDQMEITEWVPAVNAADGSAGIDGVMGVRHSGIVTGSGRFTIRPLGDGARSAFTWSESLDFPWFFGGRIGEVVAAKVVLGPIWGRNLKALKRLVEDG
jgi:hypothetical protein